MTSATCTPPRFCWPVSQHVVAARLGRSHPAVTLPVYSDVLREHALGVGRSSPRPSRPSRPASTPISLPKSDTRRGVASARTRSSSPGGFSGSSAAAPGVPASLPRRSTHCRPAKHKQDRRAHQLRRTRRERDARVPGSGRSRHLGSGPWLIGCSRSWRRCRS